MVCEAGSSSLDMDEPSKTLDLSADKGLTCVAGVGGCCDMGPNALV
jgi:hypothetical protein